MTTVAATLLCALVSVTLLLTGCAYHHTVDHTYNPETQSHDRTTFTGIVFFQKTGVEGLSVGRRSAKETSTLSINKASTETQGEALKMVVEGAVSAAVKSALPVPTPENPGFDF